MKAAVRATPPSGMQPSARATPTPPPGYVTRTLPPLGPPSRPPLPMARLAREVALTKATLAGVCMAAFSCGIVCSVAIYRFAPNLRPDCPEVAAVAPPEAGLRPPAPASDSVPARRPPAPRMPDVEPLPSLSPPPVLAPPDVAPPAPVRPAAPSRDTPAARALPVARPSSPARTASPAKKERGPGRKRPARATAGHDAPASGDSWSDPFAP